MDGPICNGELLDRDIPAKLNLVPLHGTDSSVKTFKVCQKLGNGVNCSRHRV